MYDNNLEVLAMRPLYYDTPVENFRANVPKLNMLAWGMALRSLTDHEWMHMDRAKVSWCMPYRGGHVQYAEAKQWWQEQIGSDYADAWGMPKRWCSSQNEMKRDQRRTDLITMLVAMGAGDEAMTTISYDAFLMMHEVRCRYANNENMDLEEWLRVWSRRTRTVNGHGPFREDFVNMLNGVRLNEQGIRIYDTSSADEELAWAITHFSCEDAARAVRRLISGNKRESMMTLW